MIKNTRVIVPIVIISLIVLLVGCLPVTSIVKASNVIPPQELREPASQDAVTYGVIGTTATLIAATVSAISWAEGLLNGDTGVTIKKGLPEVNLNVELGLVYEIEYSVDFRYEDSWMPGEYVWFELYILLNDEIIEFKRFPEEEVYIDIEGWDDSVTAEMQGSIDIGVKDWDCDKNIPDTFKVKAFVFQDALDFSSKGNEELYRGLGPRLGKDPVTGDITNENQFEVMPGTWELLARRIAPYTLITSKPYIRARPEPTPGIITTMVVNTENPYFVEASSDHSDNEVKKEHGNQFIHGFDTVMHYRHNYAGIEVTPPNDRVDIIIDPLDPDPGWWEWAVDSTGAFDKTPDPLKFTAAIILQRPKRQTFTFTGEHTDTIHPEIYYNIPVKSYFDVWGATVKGKNKIEYKDGEETKEKDFEWETKFRREPDSYTGCTPIFFKVWCTVPLSGAQIAPPPDSPGGALFTPYFVEYTYPANGATNVPVEACISVVFSGSMNKASAESAFIVNPPMAGKFIWISTVMSFYPAVPLDYSTEYTVIIESTAKDLAGDNIKPYIGRFVTEPAPIADSPGIADTTPPSVTYVTPADGSTNVPVGTYISVSFDEPMDKSSAESAFTLNPTVAGKIVWLDNMMLFYPTGILDYYTEYTVTIDSTAKDLAGNNIKQYIWRFVTENPLGEESETEPFAD
ncbi:Ig-like domain-containing protein [Chloroflexota bacterium]